MTTEILDEQKKNITYNTTQNALPALSQANFIGLGFNIFGSLDVLSSRLNAVFDVNKAPTQTFRFLGFDYTVPVFVIAAENSSSSFHEDTVSTREEYQNAIAASVQVGASYGAFSGQMEASFGRQFSESSQYFYSYRNFSTRLANLNLKMDLQYVSNYFIEQLEHLPSELSEENFFQFVRFFNEFGCYFISQISLGATLQYNVAISSSSSLTSMEASAMVKAEYNALFVSGSVSTDIKASGKWSNYSSSRHVNILAQGGDVTQLAELVSIDPEQPNQGSVQAYNRWASSVDQNPAVVDLSLEGIWTVCGYKEEVVKKAFDKYGQTLHRQATVTCFKESGQVPSIQLNNVTIKPSNPPMYGAGYQVVVLDRKDISAEGVKFNEYFSFDAPVDGYDEKGWQSLYTNIQNTLSRYSNSNYVVILASFGIPDNASPTSSFYQFIQGCGTGPQLQTWLNSSDPGSRFWDNSSYALVGIMRGGLNTGVEHYESLGSLELVIDFYRQDWNHMYTMSMGGSGPKMLKENEILELFKKMQTKI